MPLHPQTPTARRPGQEAGQLLLTLLLGAPGALEPPLESSVTVDVERSIPQRRWWRARRGASREWNKPGAAPLEAGRVGTAQASSAGRGSAGAGLRPGWGRSRGGVPHSPDSSSCIFSRGRRPSPCWSPTFPRGSAPSQDQSRGGTECLPGVPSSSQNNPRAPILWSLQSGGDTER